VVYVLVKLFGLDCRSGHVFYLCNPLNPQLMRRCICLCIGLVVLSFLLIQNYADLLRVREKKSGLFNCTIPG